MKGKIKEFLFNIFSFFKRFLKVSTTKKGGENALVF